MLINYHTIIVCVNFSDYLQFTYSYNRSVLEDVSIISSYDDHNTISFCNNNNIFVYQTDAFYKNNAPFNKAAGINEFLKNNQHRFANNDAILLTDADTIITEPINKIREMKQNNQTDYRQLISCPRKIFNTVEDYKNNEPKMIEEIGFYGYFQFFSTKVFSGPLSRNESPLPEYKNASKYDELFVRHYWRYMQHKLIYLSECYAHHIGNIGIHWQGRQYTKTI